MDEILLRPKAKINVSLDVIRKRVDGYHEVRMIMQTIKLHDNLLIKKTQTGRIDIKCTHPDIPTDESNLVYAACDAMRRHHGITDGFYIELDKRIPICAGLGGGSSDAAQTLLGIRKLYNLNTTDDTLINLARDIGADVPFFIYGGTKLAEGIGEVLTPLPAHPYVIVVICKPDFCVSTAHVYGNLKMQDIKTRPDTDKLIEALHTGDIGDFTAYMANVLETVTVKENPIIGDIKAAMIDYGAIVSQMCGSGPAVFGYFLNHKAARRAARELSVWPGCAKGVYLTSIST